MTAAAPRSGLRRVLTNVAFITGASLLGRLFNLVLHAALGRLFGPEGLGEYATAVAVSGYFVFIADFGLSPRLVREGAVAPERLAAEYSQALAFKIGIGAFSVALLVLLVKVLPYDKDVIELIFLLGLASIVRSFAFLNQSVCRASERLDLEGVASLSNAGFYVGVTLVLFYLGFPLRVVGWVYLAATLVQLAVSSVFASNFVSIRIAAPPWRKLGRAILPYATTSLTLLAFAQIDVLIVSVIEPQEFVGRYSAISRLLLVSGTLGSLTAAGLLPTTARIFGRAERSRFDDLINEALRCALIMGSIAALALAFTSRLVVAGVYGEQFEPLYPLLQAGSIFLVFKFVSSILEMVLTSVNQQGDRARSILFSLGSTIIFVVAWTPVWGLSGTVSAMVASELVLIGCLSGYLRSRLRWRSLIRTVLVLIAAGSLATGVHFFQGDGSGWIDFAVAAVIPLLVFVVVTFAGGEGQRALRFIVTLRRGGTNLA